MDDVACQPAHDRTDLFTEAAARRGLLPAIFEKDFWVCWMLKRLFTLPGDNNPSLVFKGGTSLSKVYGVIRRFSEDIDLSFDRKHFGYFGERDPQSAPSKTKAAKLVDNLDAAVKGHIERVFMPKLTYAVGAALGGGAVAWELARDVEDPQTVIFRYPPSLPEGDLGYIKPVVRLELGARGDPWPTEQRPVKPYAAEEFPALFKAPGCQVTVLSAERTFWEKATILHAEYHRPAEKPTKERQARHYYDLALLADSKYGERAMAQPDLLKTVVAHKTVFFASGSAGYATAQPGSLHLVPRMDQLDALNADYAQMREMIFDMPPRFDDLIARITTVEQRINAAK